MSPSDLAPVLVALGARVETNLRVLPAAELFAPALDGSTTLECGEIVLAVRVPLGDGSQGAAFKKFRPRKSIDFPVVNVAVALRLAGGVIAEARICAGAVAPVPLRLEAAEQALVGRPPAAEAFARAAEAAVATARPLRKNAYKSQILAGAHQARARGGRGAGGGAARRTGGADDQLGSVIDGERGG